nr:methyltransferase domain-containing protein [Candidatus Njordarchaeum guaymaensis]
MRLDEFVLDDNSGVYVLKGSSASAFEYSDGLDVEMRLLRIIEAATDLSSTSKELENAISDWPSRYHLSSERANLLRALDHLPRKAQVLEMGAGCGALTRYLGENFAKVDAVEGSFLRARVAEKRCGDLSNVAVYAAPFRDLDVQPKYDLVTLVGVLEYAPLLEISGRSRADACLSTLKLASSGLRKDGILLLAIENALGLKYWSGCSEDHTGRLFESIHGYPTQNSPITFSRKELRSLMCQAGFDHLAFYYPFPDYKLAKTIIHETDMSPDSLFLHNWIGSPFEDYSGKRNYSLHENLAIREICRANLLYEFANSFLILASKSPRARIRSKWIARKLTTGRALAYQRITSLYADPKPRIEKTRLSDSPVQSNVLRQRAATKRWVPGDIETYHLYEALFESDTYQALLRIFKRYHRSLVEAFSTTATDKEGYPLLAGDSFDFTFWNIVWNDRTKQYGFIDNEWEWKGRLPVDYVLFRSLYYFILSQRPYLRTRLPNTDLEATVVDLIRELYPQYDWKRQEQNRLREEMVQSEVLRTEFSLPSLSIPLEKEPPEKLMKYFAEPMGKLLALYTSRPDLQSAFPEVMSGKYSRLLEWARDSLADGRDSGSGALADYAEWYKEGEWLKLTEVKSLEVEKTRLAEELAQHELAVKSLEVEKTRLAEELNRVGMSLAQSESAVKSLEVEKTRLAEELSVAKGELAQHESTIQNLAADLNKVKYELDSVAGELTAIKGSFGYHFMRFYASRIDNLLPEGTRRGGVRKRIVASFRNLARKEIRNRDSEERRTT